MADREKVIRGLECHISTYCVECPYRKGWATCNAAETLFADALAILKEQEPARPKYIDGKRNHFIMCGKCNTDLMRGMKYCPYCGQAVKWDD